MLLRHRGRALGDATSPPGRPTREPERAARGGGAGQGRGVGGRRATSPRAAIQAPRRHRLHLGGRRALALQARAARRGAASAARRAPRAAGAARGARCGLSGRGSSRNPGQARGRLGLREGNSCDFRGSRGSPQRQAALALAGAGEASAHGELASGGSAIAPGDCYALRSLDSGNYVIRTDGGLRAAAGAMRDAEAFRAAATGLGSFMFLDRSGALLSAGALGRVTASLRATRDGDWRVRDEGGALRLTSVNGARQLAVGDSGHLVMREGGSRARAGMFAAEQAQGCAAIPEVETDVTGEPSKGRTPYGEVRGFLDTHLHGMAFEFLGGRAHCGKPWDPMGVTVALRDCPDHEPERHGRRARAPTRHGSPFGTHDPVGWPTFNDWPAYDSLTHEDTYYKWIERAWRGGQRIHGEPARRQRGSSARSTRLKQPLQRHADTVRLEAQAT